MLDRAADLALEHAEMELSIQPRTFARKKRPVFADIDAALDEYAKSRAFFITGVIKQDVLDGVKTMMMEWMRTHLEPYPDKKLVSDIEALVKDYLPTKDAAGRIVVPARRAELIARVNIMDMYNFTRLVLFDTRALRGWVVAYQYSAILDGRTTELCRRLNGRIFTRETLNGFRPPTHFNCRSILLPITKNDIGWEDKLASQEDISADLKPQEGFGWQ